MPKWSQRKLAFGNRTHGNGDRIIRSQSGHYSITEKADGGFVLSDLEDRPLLESDLSGSIDHQSAMLSEDDLVVLGETRTQVDEIAAEIAQKIKIKSTKSKAVRKNKKEAVVSL